MPEGKRWGVGNPSPTMKSFTAYINEHEGEGFISEDQVASTYVHHRKWQEGHAQELVAERAEAKATREAEAEKRKADRAEKKRIKDEEKAQKDAEAAEKKAQKEREKAEREAAGADGDDSDSSPADGEAAQPRKRLRTRGEPAEPVAAGVSEQAF